MKILVTGGAGFIGSAVVRHIIKNTQDIVVNVDKLTYAGNLESLAEVSEYTATCHIQMKWLPVMCCLCSPKRQLMRRVVHTLLLKHPAITWSEHGYALMVSQRLSLTVPITTGHITSLKN